MLKESLIRTIIDKAKVRDFNVIVLIDEKTGEYLRKAKGSTEHNLPGNEFVTCHLNLGGSRTTTTLDGKQKISFRASENRNFTVVFFDNNSEKRNTTFRMIKSMLEEGKFELVGPKKTITGKEHQNAELMLTLPGKMLEVFVDDYFVVIDGKRQVNAVTKEEITTNTITVFIPDDDGVDGFGIIQNEYNRRVLPNIKVKAETPVAHSVVEE